MFIYLASPYTPTGTETIADRVASACRCAAKLMADGETVFSPIAHSHAVADHLPDDARLDHEFWMRQDLPILAAASRIVVLRLPGWDRSRGIARELAFAIAHSIPIEYIDP